MRTFGKIVLSSDGTRWTIEKAEPHVSIKLKTIFAAIPKASAAPYELKRSLTVDADIEWFMQRYPLAISANDRKALDAGCAEYSAQQVEMESILLPTFESKSAASLREGQTLRQYQWQIVEILRRRKSLLCGDEGGLGKTFCASGFLAIEPMALPAAVVCDAHMQQQWKEKIELFTNLRVHLIERGRAYSLPSADVYVYRVSQVAGWSDIFQTGFFKSAIYDEPQSLRAGTSTNKGTACAYLSDNVTFRLGLTGTPVYNYGGEIWNIMRFIDRSVLGDWDDFIREWCKPVGNGKYSVRQPKALGSFLREQYAMIRRTKADIGQQLPKVSRIVEHVDYDEAAVRSVEDLANALAIKATTGSFVERGSAVRELDIMVRRATGVSKAKTVAAFVRLLVEAGESVILWGWHREVYRIWNEELADMNPAMYTGSETATQKESAKKRFLAGETNILIMSLRSGAGVDGLQFRCSTGVFGELDWSPGIHNQCVWRIDREGQKNPVTVFFLVVDEGSDPPIMEVLGVKSSEARGIVDPGLGVEIRDNDGSGLKRLVDRYLSKKSTKSGKV